MTSLTKPTSRTIPSLLAEIAELTPHREALVVGDERWTYERSS